MTTSDAGKASVRARRAEKAALEREIKERQRAVLVVNTRSRRGARAYAEAKRQLAAAGMILEAAYPVRNAERLPEIVRDEIGKGRKFIIIGGGDGTVSSVVDHFADTSAVFGVLPLGTANSFVRTLGIPLDVAGAVDVLVNGKVADVDLARINGDYFANGASIGMPAIVGRATPHKLKRWLGRGAYGLVATSQFLRYEAFRCTVTINGEATSYRALDVRIANGAYQGGVLVAPEASPDDGKIVVHILTGPSRWALAREWARLALKAPFSPGEGVFVRAPELVIDADPVQHVSVDGEVVTQTPIQLSVARGALLLMVPKAFEDRD